MTATLNSWKHLALVAFLLLTAATTLFVWMSYDRREAPRTVAEREPERPIESALAAKATDGREPQTAAGSDLAQSRPEQAPRTVSAQQASIAAEVLRAFPLDQRPLAEPIAVLALIGDHEAAEYAKQLAQILKDGGWATTMGTTTVRYTGVMCLVDNATQFPVHARALTFAFERAGIACTAANNGGPPSSRIEVVVGQKSTD